jgi:hypothetical protein
VRPSIADERLLVFGRVQLSVLALFKQAVESQDRRRLENRGGPLDATRREKK